LKEEPKPLSGQPFQALSAIGYPHPNLRRNKMSEQNESNNNSNSNSNTIKIPDIAYIAQSLIIAILVGLAHTVIQVRQDIALLKDQVSNYVIAKEFAAFKAVTEQHDIEFEKRIERLERAERKEK
jgi:hypothetical protein